jgi:sporulation protein YlmC with PRC-barrel domain
LAAQPSAADTANAPITGGKNVALAKLAEKCLSDVRAFSSQMQKDGYWLGGSSYGYGYPMGGFGYGYAYSVMGMGGQTASAIGSYTNARPGYEVRTLIASANILAQNGQQQECESVLATTRSIYKIYMAEMQAKHVSAGDGNSWQQQQIAAALPVINEKAGFRSDQLLEADVRNPGNDALGSVHDLIMDPQTGKIAYLVIARGGIFGFEAKYVPVPWADFKITGNMSLLVLDTSKAAMDAAPEVTDDQFTAPSHFENESQKIDAYWKAHISDLGSN